MKGFVFTALAGAVMLLGAVAAPVANAQQPPTPGGNDSQQVGGAAGLVAAVVQASTGDVLILNNSLNNVDLDVLENILNNSPFLNNIDVDVLTGAEFLNDSLNICAGSQDCIDIIDDVTVQDIVVVVDVLGLAPGIVVI